MYNLKIFRTLFFIFIIIIILLLFLFAIINDKIKSKTLLKEKKLIDINNYYDCIYENNKNFNKNFQECLDKQNILENKINDLINLNSSNNSLTKIMINSSIEGAISGSIFGYIISKTEGLLVGFILFAVLNPIMKFTSHILKINNNLIN